jgi:hypothetical protein
MSNVAYLPLPPGDDLGLRIAQLQKVRRADIANLVVISAHSAQTIADALQRWRTLNHQLQNDSLPALDGNKIVGSPLTFRAERWERQRHKACQQVVDEISGAISAISRAYGGEAVYVVSRPTCDELVKSITGASAAELGDARLEAKYRRATKRMLGRTGAVIAAFLLLITSGSLVTSSLSMPIWLIGPAAAASGLAGSIAAGGLRRSADQFHQSISSRDRARQNQYDRQSGIVRTAAEMLMTGCALTIDTRVAVETETLLRRAVVDRESRLLEMLERRYDETAISALKPSDPSQLPAYRQALLNFHAERSLAGSGESARHTVRTMAAFVALRDADSVNRVLPEIAANWTLLKPALAAGRFFGWVGRNSF